MYAIIMRIYMEPNENVIFLLMHLCLVYLASSNKIGLNR